MADRIIKSRKLHGRITQKKIWNMAEEDIYIYIHISPEQKQDIADDLRLSGTITIDGEGDNEAVKQSYERNEMEIVNNYAPFTEFINNANKVKKNSFIRVAANLFF